MGLNKNNLIAWHDRSTSEHKKLVEKWAAEGFRTLSLTIYGTPDEPQFAAVMVKRDKVIATKQVGPLSKAGFQEAFEEMADKGFGPYLITATGPAGAQVYAAVFRKFDKIPLTRSDLTAEEFKELNNDQREKNRILVSADAFGSPLGDTRYCAVWVPNTDHAAWACDAIDEEATALQQRYEAMKATWNRPALISVTPLGRHLEMFTSSTIGKWASRTGMTSAEYQDYVAKKSAEGLWPICVSAAGAGSGARFACIVATREETDQRVYRTNGPVTVAGIDAAMEAYVKDHRLRGSALAITRGTRLVYAKGYTYAEPSPIYPDVEPTTLFRQASVSKAFAAVALFRIMQSQPSITLGTTLQSILNIKQPDGSAPKDSRFKNITLKHLLESDSGLPQGAIYDVKQASDAAGGTLPTTMAELASYVASKDLTGAPGDPNNSVYGNFDYLMLSMVVTKLSGESTFEAALKKLVLNPLAMSRTTGSSCDPAAQPAGHARHHMQVYKMGGWDLYPLEVRKSIRHADRRLVAAQYGGWDYELFDGCGGLSSAVVDVARLAAMFSDDTDNPVLTTDSIDAILNGCLNAGATLKAPDGGGSHGYYGFDWASGTTADMTVSKGGWLPSHGTVIRFTRGGFGFAIANNCNGAAGVETGWFDAVSAAAMAHTWDDDADLFPSYGMPSLSGFTFSKVTVDNLKKIVAAHAFDLSETMAKGMKGRVPLQPKKGPLIKPLKPVGPPR